MKNLLKSILSTALAVCMILGCITCVSADTPSVPLSGNYTFLNVAYSPDADTYVAVAKDLTNTSATPMKILVSKNGYLWNEAKSFSPAKNNLKDSSRQILTYWDKEKVFVACAGTQVLYSADGLSWTNFVTATEGAMVTVFNHKLVLNERGVAADKTYYYFREFNSLNAEDFTQIKYPFASYQYRRYIAVNTEGYFISDIQPSTTAYATYIKNDGTATTIYPNKIDITTSIAYLPYCDKNIAAVNTAKVRTIKSGISGEIAVNLHGGDTIVENTSIITAVGYANGKTYLGTKDGKIYYTSESTDITNDTVWNVLTNESKNEEEIKAIAQGKDGAVAVSATKLFLISGDSYKDVNDGFFIGAPTLKGVNIFSGVSLFGGAYGEGIGYVVYGNTTDGKGNIYFSEDGINWELVHSSGVKFNTNQNGGTFLYNNCIYWENNGLFLISMGGNATGACFTSFDGKKWGYSDTTIPTSNNGNIGLGLNSNLAVNGDYIYTANPSAIQQYLKTSFEIVRDIDTNIPQIKSHTTVPVTGNATGNYAFDFIAVSDETNPFIFMNAGHGVKFGHNTAGEGSFTLGYSFIDASSGNVLKEVKWNSVLSKFVGVRKDKPNAYLFGTNLSPANKKISDSNLTSFDTNGTNYVFGDEGGKLYKVVNTALDTTSPSPTEIIGTNTLPIQSIIKGIDGGFLAVATNSKDSDILLVNAGCTAYEKASDKTVVTPAPDNKAVLSIDAVNNTDTPVTFKMITAIYDGNKLVQTVMSDKSIAAGNTGAITEEITFNENVNENCTMRVYMWGGDNFMNPIAGATDFFQ